MSFCKGFEISDIITQSTVLQDLPEVLTPQQLLKHTRTILPLVLAGRIRKLKSSLCDTGGQIWHECSVSCQKNLSAAVATNIIFKMKLNK